VSCAYATDKDFLTALLGDSDARPRGAIASANAFVVEKSTERSRRASPKIQPVIDLKTARLFA
jgi:hypothetical protein